MRADKQKAEKIEQFSGIFGTRLKEIREEKKLSQKLVAEKLGVAVSTYANWEQGRRAPSIYDIYLLLSVYDVEANELFDVSGIENL